MNKKLILLLIFLNFLNLCNASGVSKVNGTSLVSVQSTFSALHNYFEEIMPNFGEFQKATGMVQKLMGESKPLDQVYNIIKQSVETYAKNGHQNIDKNYLMNKICRHFFRNEYVHDYLEETGKI